MRTPSQREERTKAAPAAMSTKPTFETDEPDSIGGRARLPAGRSRVTWPRRFRLGFSGDCGRRLCRSAFTFVPGRTEAMRLARRSGGLDAFANSVPSCTAVIPSIGSSSF